MKQETFLPVFPGFYNTIFEPELMEHEDREFLSSDCFEDDPVDYDGTAKSLVKCVEEKLRNEGFELSLHFQRLNNPREYNFRNDSIDVIIDFTEDDLKIMREYLRDNIDSFSKYLKENYTSYDGFISNYSTYTKDWLYTFHESEHQLGSVLNFILEEVFEYSQEDLYGDLTYFGEHMHYDERVIPEFQQLLDQINNYTLDNYLKADAETVANEAYNMFGENVEYECTFDPNFFVHVVNEVYNRIDNKVGKLF